jgi:hypothetical protein
MSLGVNRILELDGLRAFMVMLVVLYHMTDFAGSLPRGPEWIGNVVACPCEVLPGSRRMQVAYRLCELLLPKVRRLPLNTTFYGGSSWWNLTREAAEAIFEYIRQNP